MACEKEIKAIEEKQEEKIEIEEVSEMERTQAGVLVMRKVPEFEMDAYDAKTGKYVKVSSEDYKGKWLVVCFYPADFTFVCPTEIAAMNAKYDELQSMGVEVLAVSTDTKFSHKRFAETEPLLKDLKLTIGADPTGEVSRKFGVLIEEEGLALRGRFLVNPDGVVVAEEVQGPSVGRNVNEFIRQIQAWQHVYKTGEVCPANWRPSKKTLPVNKEVEKMTGRVGDYVTVEELLS
ncbi:peroxiredoxin [Hippea maritima]|uniref:Alkyl hydroperoxide reductase C n=1 Tax=Hippea maritima (strain ATCC 700847 / DSM 10411 / MH2) TaxID=760142 RepID=F2LVD6_HIPMA|nr:peroxiredoxin [Hippea maritima]AEA33720.1 Peroxiredoxin [Hippea maritima DSM 10411]